MFDPCVWNHVDNTIYIVRESILLANQREQEKKSSVTGNWSLALVIRHAVTDLRKIVPAGNA